MDVRKSAGRSGPRAKRIMVGSALALVVIATVALVAIALTSHGRSDLAGTVPAGGEPSASPTPTPVPTATPLSTVSPTPAPTAPTPSPTPGPLPVIEGTPEETTGYVQFSDSIPFGNVTQEDPSQPVGVSYVSVTGSEGVLLTTIEVNYTDGVETSRSVISREITAAPVDQVTVIGTGSASPETPSDPAPVDPAPVDPTPEEPPVDAPTTPPVPAPEG